MLTVSERYPTYYDFCFADESGNACCWSAKHTFAGITHSGDNVNGQNFLSYATIDPDNLTATKLCVFISGYNYTPITRFRRTNPALLAADHVNKVNKETTFLPGQFG